MADTFSTPPVNRSANILIIVAVVGVLALIGFGARAFFEKGNNTDTLPATNTPAETVTR